MCSRCWKHSWNMVLPINSMQTARESAAQGMRMQWILNTKIKLEDAICILFLVSPIFQECSTSAAFKNSRTYIHTTPSLWSIAKLCIFLFYVYAQNCTIQMHAKMQHVFEEATKPNDFFSCPIYIKTTHVYLKILLCSTIDVFQFWCTIFCVVFRCVKSAIGTLDFLSGGF